MFWFGRNLAQFNGQSGFITAVLSKTNVPSAFRKSQAEQITRCVIESARRKLVWVERQNFQGWACSECAWAFNPLGPPLGRSMDEMKEHFEQQRDMEFKSHVCTEYARAPKNPR